MTHRRTEIRDALVAALSETDPLLAARDYFIAATVDVGNSNAEVRVARKKAGALPASAIVPCASACRRNTGSTACRPRSMRCGRKVRSG